MPKPFPLILVVAILAAAPTGPAAEEVEDDYVAWLIRQSEAEREDISSLALTFDLRLRQESLQKVFYFDHRHDSRNWLRLRSRAGLLYDHGSHRLGLRLVNEFRDTYLPDRSWIPLDELIVDRLYWTWGAREEDPFTLTLGRQDIIWDDGFLILEGHPLDGSRSIYHNAMRLQIHDRSGEYEFLGILGPQTDPMVLAGDQERHLGDNDEIATAIRYSSPVGTSASMIWKREREIAEPRWEWCNFTFSLRQEWRGLMGEFALQRHSTAEWAYASQGRAGLDLLSRTRGELGYFYYSGAGNNEAAFRTPFGRWPKWSELYIYTLIGEEGVAAWRNIGALHGHLRQNIARGLDLRLSAYWLGAPEPEWKARGILLQSELSFALNAWLSGHFLWEYLDPGSFHEGLDEGQHFLRWEINTKLN